MIFFHGGHFVPHYNNALMSAMASQITNLTIVYLTVYSRRRSKKKSKLHVTGRCEGNSPVTGEFPAQRASNAENVSIWWRHHGPQCPLRTCGPVDPVGPGLPGKPLCPRSPGGPMLPASPAGPEGPEGPGRPGGPGSPSAPDIDDAGPVAPVAPMPLLLPRGPVGPVGPGGPRGPGGPENHLHMMTSRHWNAFRIYCPFVTGIHRRPLDSPQKGKVICIFGVL